MAGKLNCHYWTGEEGKKHRGVTGQNGHHSLVGKLWEIRGDRHIHTERHTLQRPHSKAHVMHELTQTCINTRRPVEFLQKQRETECT